MVGTEGSRLDVVLDLDAQPEGPRQRVRQLERLDVEVDGVPHETRARVDEPGHAGPGGADASETAHRVGDLAGEPHGDLDDLRPAAARRRAAQGHDSATVGDGGDGGLGAADVDAEEQGLAHEALTPSSRPRARATTADPP